MIQLGINGFGRIGRVVLRACLQKSDLEITAINDPAIDVEYICYLIKFDSTHGKYNGSVGYSKDEILVNDFDNLDKQGVSKSNFAFSDKRIKVFHEKLPAQIPWQTAGVQYVVESSGMFTNLEKAAGHLASESVKRVLVTAPSIDAPMIILGVNDNEFLSDHKVISCASSTLYCLAPIIKVLEDNFGVAEGFVTSIHAMTPSLKPLDGLCLRGRHWRDHRSIHQNIIPAATGACKALGKIIPRVKDRLAGIAFRVPIVNVSVLDLTIRLGSNTTIKEIIEKVEKASTSVLKNIIKISKDDAVSSDFLGETCSCVLDADFSLQLKSNYFKLVCWYENEYSYACRVIDSIYLSENKFSFTYITMSPKRNDSVQQTECSRKDILSSVSQDTGLKFKTQSRNMLLKKPLSIHPPGAAEANTDKKNSNKKIEMFKIWNDEKEKPKAMLRQNKNSSFHSCVAISPQTTEEIDCAKAQERLQILKSELSKLVNITENLLKKSYASNLHTKSEDRSEDNTNKNVSKDKSFENHSEILAEGCNELENSCVGDTTSGTYSYKSKSLSSKEKDKKLEEIIPQFNMKIKKDHIELPNIDHNRYKTEKIKDHIQKTENNSASETSPKSSFPSQLTTETLTPAKDIHNQITSQEQSKFSDIKSLTSYLLSNVQVQYFNNHKIDRDDVEKNIDNKFFGREVYSKIKNNLFCNTKSNYKSDVPKNNNDNTKNITELITENKDVIATKADLNKEKVLTKKEIKEEINVANSVSEIQNTNKNSTKCENSPTLSVKSYNDNPSTSMIDGHRISPERISLFSDGTSKYGSPNSPSLMSHMEVYKHKDIYDKLDSISGTDSDNSFQIDERKSQVINITDLTSSLEDLARLDKICKIIEISDDLSNKLFASLQNSEGIDIKKKKWSFKDLCEKIKLDDFCESLFGK